jgi:lipid-A-disaccharide synthase
LRLFIIAGEPSGDLHGSNLVYALRAKRPDLRFEGFGGPLMQAAGVHLHRDLRHLSFMGFVEVLRNLGHVIKNFRVAKQAIAASGPDALVLIDYPGFNLRLAKWAKAHGMKVIWYIAPQTWAWKEGRVHDLRQHVDELLCILPFEEAYFKSFGVNARFVGHPLLDVALSSRIQKPFDHESGSDKNVSRPLIALLPGSRKQEVSRILPEMVKVMPYLPDYQWAVACSPHVPMELYRKFVPAEVHCHTEGTSALLQRAHAALVTSGTATLETALHHVPQIVCYRANALSIAIARMLVKVRFISLVNLILDRQAVPELIQADLNTERLATELRAISVGESRTAQLVAYDELIGRLGGKGASERAAQAILSKV